MASISLTVSNENILPLLGNKAEKVSDFKKKQSYIPVVREKRIEENIFEKALRYRRALNVYTCWYISACDISNRRERRLQLDKISTLVSDPNI